MAYRDLREFVAKLEKEGELKRVRAEVDPVLEITEVAQRVARDKGRARNSVGPALFFEKPKGSRVPWTKSAGVRSSGKWAVRRSAGCRGGWSG